MRTFAVGLWKEWRDHRLVSIALLVALPVLVFASAWAFGDQLPQAAFGGLTLFTLNAAQALYVLAVASESFGGERRRGTLDFLRRLPRGLGRAFAAKLGAYVLGNVAALLWGAVVAWSACKLFGPPRAAGDLALLLLQPDPLTVVVVCALFVLGLWTLLLSNVIPQGGAATIGAALLLGLLGLPVFLALKDRPWLVRLPDFDTIKLGLAALGSLGLVALAYAFLRGNRLLASAWSPAWRGLALVGVVASAGYACGAVALERALTIDPHDSEFRIAGAFLGKGGRYLYATVYRGPYPYFNEHDTGSEAGSPHQPWIIDLNDGSWRVAGDYFQGWMPPVWNNQRTPQAILKRHAYQGKEVAWFDGETGELRKVLPDDVRTPEILTWQRSVMPGLAWHRDAEGRALWLEGDRIVREGEQPPMPKWVGSYDPWYEAIPGGWIGSALMWDKDQRSGRWTTFVSDVTTGKATKYERAPAGVHDELLLSPKTVLRRIYGPPSRGARGALGPWKMWDIQSGAILPAVNPPDAVLLGALPGERALLMAGTDKNRQVLSSWNPRTGEVTPILDEHDAPFVGYGGTVTAQVPGGLSIVHVYGDRQNVASASFALLDEELGRTRRLPALAWHSRIVAIESRDSFVVLTPANTVVRHRSSTQADGRSAFVSETLFPR